ncbi:hypothetical protein GGR04_000034 [Aureimonas pseudogalii]|uniref:DUF2076 domain-containing protein n=2 Tax=Aureimonas pseudogalii TaxID=1744844 RepID=A0A7W6H2V6_9HYPH|nr:hypothetical protein [Aureimonas pseudogalii]
MIEGLFDRLGEAERQSPPRDAEAERLIREQIATRPAGPYYMAQTMIVQQEALKAAQARIEELERATRERPEPTTSGGFLGGLFGSGGAAPARDDRRPHLPSGTGASPSYAPSPYAPAQTPGPWGSAPAAAPMGTAPAAASRGGGFLAGAAQTAVGVAGGVMLGSMLGNLFSGTGHSFLGGAGGLGGGETIVENNVTENFYGDPADTSGIDTNGGDSGFANADYDTMTDDGFDGGGFDDQI